MSTLESKVFEDLEKALEDLDLVSAVSMIKKKYLEDINNISLNIAVTGQSGVGKSTVVNAFRGIDNTDERAAPTGVETTKPEPYPHPIYPNVTLWDLPGIGTTNFPADQYLERSGFENVDLFIIVSAGRFRENDAKLAQEIKKMGKKFYFVRSKIDNNLSDAKRGQREYDEERTLQEIRENCIQELEQQGVASPQVFLVSGFDLHLYDFPALQDTMERELPSHKRDVLNRGIPKVCKSIINKKKEVFSSQIWYYALTSAAVAAVPIPGLSFAADVGILVRVLTNYLNGFGLDEESLVKLSSDTNTPLDDLRAEMKCLCSGQNVTIELVSLMLHSLPLLTGEAAKEGSRWIPVLGIPIAASISYTFITSFLTSTLDSLSVDAESVLIKALDWTFSSLITGYSVAVSNE
ncbi:interferon-inducible GTPase 5-like isoform X2 [Gadus chalcogrammus]|uniref:interferon-inducible GTPase 5-like isoform X2 n=1 Tax=Gadus chalcogrammus TaxID=1042646 RepID=UPI0024C48B6B|nr:interferon-inducible GTPase 5-like isoform X2 [Gadus chalcogrammus]